MKIIENHYPNICPAPPSCTSLPLLTFSHCSSVGTLSSPTPSSDPHRTQDPSDFVHSNRCSLQPPAHLLQFHLACSIKFHWHVCTDHTLNFWPQLSWPCFPSVFCAFWTRLT
uniref:Uncharacterized protein n=1 Tax=Cynoglossus semilaevis TaxID=244447 RepID=A0A3P8WND5_CYNSE